MGRTTNMRGAWKALADALGGVGKLADALGRNRSTIERWASGERVPPVEVQAAVGELAARHGVAMPAFGGRS